MEAKILITFWFGFVVAVDISKWPRIIPHGHRYLAKHIPQRVLHSTHNQLTDVVCIFGISIEVWCWWIWLYMARGIGNMIADVVMSNDSFPAASQKHKQKYLYLSSDSPSLWNSSNRASSVAFLHSFRPCCFFALMATRHSLTHKASFPWRFFLAREASIRNSASSLVFLQDKHQPAVRPANEPSEPRLSTARTRLRV